MADRMALVDRMRARLEAREWPRVHAALLLALSAAVAFLASVVLLALDVRSMAVRYALAGLCGYGAFVLLLRAWVRWKQSRLTDDDGDLGLEHVADAIDIIEVPRTGGGGVSGIGFGGGRSGGGGASMVWGQPPQPAMAPPATPKTGGFSLDFDADDLVWVLVAIAAALAGVTAVAYVIYIAPILFAEVIVNAAIASGMYRGMTRRAPQHWTTQVLRRTAVPAGILLASLALGGYALGRIAPEARSIGGVIAHLSER